MNSTLIRQHLHASAPDLYQTETIDRDDKIAVAHFYYTGRFTWHWYVIEYDGTDQCFGLVKGWDEELGYFSLTELDAIITPYGSVVYDAEFKPTRLGELDG